MPLIQSKSKKALEHNIEVEMKAHPSKKKRDQNLAIAFSVQRKNKKKYANGGQIGLDAMKKENYAAGGLAKDQEPVNPKVNSKLGSEYEGDNNPGTPGKKPDDRRPSEKEYMAGDMQGYAQGGSIYGGKAEEDRNPGLPKAKSDDRRPDSNDYMSDDWAGGPDLDGVNKNLGPSEEEYMANHMKMLAKGGHVACMHCGGMGYADGGEIHDSVDESHDIDADEDGRASIVESILAKRRSPFSEEDDFGSSDEEHAAHAKYAEGGEINDKDEVDDPFDKGEGISTFQEEGPGERRKYNQYARDYNQGDDRQLSKQPMDSNEDGDQEEKDDEDEHDMVSQIRKKLKASRG